MNMSRLAMLSIIVAVATGCAPYKLPSAVNAPKEDLVLVYTDAKRGNFIGVGWIGGYEVHIDEIDGKAIPILSNKKILEVPAGMHSFSGTVDWGFFTGGVCCYSFFRHTKCGVSFEAKAGAEYLIGANTEPDPIELIVRETIPGTISRLSLVIDQESSVARYVGGHTDKETWPVIAKAPCK